MKSSFIVNRKYAGRPGLRGLWRRSRPVLVALVLISGSFNRTSGARDVGPVPADGFSPVWMVRSSEGAGREGSLSLHLSELRMPALSRAGKAIGPFSPLGVGGRLTSKEAAPVGRLSDAVGGRLVERGDRRISLGEGRDVTAVFNGRQELAQALERDEAMPLSMASG